MALAKPVLLRNCQHLSEARYAAGMEVPYIGFTFSTTDTDEKRHTITAIWQWLAGVELVAELHEANPELVATIRQEYAPSLWLVPSELIHLLQPEEKYVTIGAAPAGTTSCVGQLLSIAEAGNHLDSETPLWVELTDADQRAEADAIASVLVISGRPEERPGFPDLSFAADVLEQLELE